MSQETIITLSRDVEAAIVPTGEPVTLEKGQEARITQELGGAFTVIVNGNMARIAGVDADAIGLTVEPLTFEPSEKTDAVNSCRTT